MIAGLKIAKEIGAREILLYNDSELAVKQINAECRVIDDRLRKYLDHINLLKTLFDKVDIQHVSRNKNCQADAFSS